MIINKSVNTTARIWATFHDATGALATPDTTADIGIYPANSDTPTVATTTDMTALATGVYYYAWDVSAVAVGNYTARFLFTSAAVNYGGVLDILVIDIPNEVWDEVISTGHSTANSAGKIVYDNVNAPLNTIDTNVDSILVDTGTDIPALIDALPTAAENATELLDHSITAHNTAATAGAALNDIATAGLGSGGTDVGFTITDTDGTAEGGVQVVVYSDVAMTTGNEVTGTMYTDSQGKVTCYLNSGTYYAKATKEGKTFNNPNTVTVP